MNRLLLVVLLCALGLALARSAGGAETHPFGAQDLVSMDRVSDPDVSPDGKWIVFAVSSVDLEKNRRRSDLWLVGSDGSGLRHMTSHEANDTSPRFPPDGRWIVFLSTRSGVSQVWRMPLDGGEPQQVTRFPLDVGSFRLSPDGAKLAVSLDVFPDADGSEPTKKRLDEIAARKTSGRVFERLFIRHWDAWKDGRRSHLFVLPVEGGDAVDVMKGLDADSPTKPFGGAEEYAFSPDGRSIVFTARDAGREEAWSTNLDLFVAPSDGATLPRKLTSANPATDTHPVFSPDGKTLAYLSMSRPGYEADRYRIMLRSWPDGRERELAPEWDRSAEEIAWSPDGKTLYALAQSLGQKSLFGIEVPGGRVRTIVEKGTVRSVLFAGGRMVYALDHLESPVELYSARLDGTDVKPITSVNAERLAAVRLGKPEQFSFQGWNGERVHVYVVRPADFDPSKKYPVAFLIHGGPQGSFGNDFHYRWNPQVYAGAGYAAVMVDFHGSTGYGQAFTDSIRGDWGGKPLEDLKRGLDATLRRYAWMDGERVAALGASFGGYMVNWIAGQWPDRFRCLVTHDGNLDERMAYYDTEELWFPEWDHEGTPWQNPGGYTKHNPIDHVGKWKTPMLVIHGALDYRVVETQGISTFTALQRRGIPSKFLYFPDENHWVLKPQNSLFWHETVLGWLDRWTRK